MSEVAEFFSGILAADNWPARWYCGKWSDFHGWLYIMSSFAIWGAYFAIPVLIAFFASKKRNIPFRNVFYLFTAFILFCGFGHLIDGLIFWVPVYRLSALVLFGTAVVSWLTVFALIKVIPEVLTLKTTVDFEKEIEQYKEELNKQAEQTRFLADKMPNIVWTTKADGKLDYLNAFALNYFGKSMQDLEDWKWTEMAHPEDREENVRLWKEAIETGNDFVIEHRLKDSAGRYFWHLTKGSAHRNKSGVIEYWVGTGTNIQEQKTEMEKKDEFIGIASHELKTPLTTLKAYTQLLESEIEKKETGPESSYMKKMQASLSKLEGLIADLLDVSKIQSGKLEMKYENVNISELLKDVLEINANTSKTHKITFSGSSNGTIKGDKFRIEQVIMNYISNAIKYSPAANEVKLVLGEKENEIEVCVEDFGEGFEENEKEKLFERFYRSSSPVKVSGMGIGLFICREIIQRHNGRVWAERKSIGKGSKFYFTIPISEKQ
jgi:PAS domain S-box-containing protein